MNLRQKRHTETFNKLGTIPSDWDIGSMDWTVVVKPNGEDCCQLCGRKNILNYYPMINRKKDIMIYVGSECVKTWIESCYDDYVGYVGKVLKDEFKSWKNIFFKQYEGYTKPKRNLAHRVYDASPDDLEELKKIYRLAYKLDYDIPERVEMLLRL